MKLKKIVIATLAMLSMTTAVAETRSVGGAAYLLSMPKDISEDFLDLSNTYFFADSLVDFDTATGEGHVEWKRQQLMPRQAFNANTYLHQPLQSLDFPNTAYPQNPQLGISVTPVNERTLRVRMHTSDVLPPQGDEVMLVAEPVSRHYSWKISRRGNDVVYTSPHGSFEIQSSPWRLVLKDADGRVLTQTRAWSDNDSTQIKVPPFSFIKRGSDNSRSINPVFSLVPGEKIYGCGESPTALNKVGQKLNIFVTDPQGPEGRDMYKPIPF